MTPKDWVDFIVAILSGLAMGIPLVYGLITYVKKAVKEKNWQSLIDLVMNLMERAEQMFADGATKKEWVMAMVIASSDAIDYDIDKDTLSVLIDRLCDMSNVINAPTTTEIDGDKAGE